MKNVPQISVVMGVYNGAAVLPETIDSVLVQTERDVEFLIVNDGSTDPQIAQLLEEYERRDGRIRIITKPNEGLTKALIAGCAMARGVYIARIDAGDVMPPERLEKQKALLDQNPAVVFVSCWTEFCGPEWEPLYVEKQGIPEAAYGVGLSPGKFMEDVKYGPTHHGSVTFRADAYRRAGGYRWQFYYGQDWDLWYRLADLGKFAGVQSTLYRCRILSDGISMKNVERQRRIHECSYGAFQVRRQGKNETLFVEKAVTIRPGVTKDEVPSKKSSAKGKASEGHYFIGEALRRNGDRRCRKYLIQAVAGRPLMLKGWVRLFQSLVVYGRQERARKSEC